MGLAKLWNAIFGSAEKAATSRTVGAPQLAIASATKSPIVPTATTMPTGGAKALRPSTGGAQIPVDKPSRKKAKLRTSRHSKPAEPIVTVEPTATLRMFRRKNNAWTKVVGSRIVHSILDIDVGDGSRAVELLEAIVDSNSPPPKYVAIGLFELAGEKLTVRQFHQKVRAVGGQAIVIPLSLADGLRRLSQTMGTVDLVLLNGHDNRVSDPVVVRLLQRVAPANSLVLRSDSSGRWQPMSAQSRKAA